MERYKKSVSEYLSKYEGGYQLELFWDEIE